MKNLKNLGKTLSKTEQKAISGGLFGGGYLLHKCFTGGGPGEGGCGNKSVCCFVPNVGNRCLIQGSC